MNEGRPEAVVVVSRSGTLASWGSAAGGGPSWRCVYHPLVSFLGSDQGTQILWSDVADPVEGTPYLLACYVGTDLVMSRGVIFDPGDPFAGLAAVERSRDEARRQLDPPAPAPALNPPGEQLVGVPTWLWLDGDWAESSATASVGAVSSTVRARPVRATWDMGDGTTVTCDAGTRYDPDRPPESQASSCTHVFTSDSRGAPGGAVEVTVTVGYEVSWDASTGVGGTLEGITRSASFPVVVQEAQALIR